LRGFRRVAGALQLVAAIDPYQITVGVALNRPDIVGNRGGAIAFGTVGVRATRQRASVSGVKP
jgi:hypothetical protein